MKSPIDQELEFHFAEVVDSLVEQGWTEAAARREAERRFGDRIRYRRGLERIDRRARRRWSVRFYTFDALIRDVRQATRALARVPGFTLGVVLTLALGIGANGVVFSAINSVLLQPLPFPDGDRLMRLQQLHERAAETNIAPVRLEDWQRLNSTFDAITGYYTEDVSETSGEFPDKVRRAWVAPRFLAVWGVGPARGRDFTPQEHLESGPRAVIVSDRFWRERLSADPGVLSRVVRIGAASFPIVGVMPATFRFPDRGVDVWFPVALDFKYAQSRQNTWYTGVGRLKGGVTLVQARADLDAIQVQLGREHPDTDRTIGVSVVPLKDVTVGDAGRSLWLLFGGVSLVLLITCTNVAGLLLARSTHRRREIAVRLSLGASRSRVAAQLLIETLLLSLAGGGLGLAVAGAATGALRRATSGLPRMDELAIDWTVVVYTLVVAFVVAALCGVLPTIRAGRQAVGRALTEGSRTQVSTRQSLQWWLVGGQVALSVILLAGAGLLVRSLHELARIEAGFDPARVLTFRVSGHYGETVDYDRLTARIHDTIDALRTLPGVDAVASSAFLPGVPSDFEHTFTLVESRNEASRQLVAQRRFVSPEYFETLKIPVLEGALCDRSRSGRWPRLIMINQAFRDRYLAAWPSPIGLSLAASNDADQAARIAGVTANARDRGIDDEPAPTVYSCISAPNPTPYFLARTQADPLVLAPAIRIAMREREPQRSVYEMAPLADRIGDAFTENRLRATVLTGFAVSALALAGLGLYGTLSYVVNLRRREVGLRLALGAGKAAIVRQFFAKGVSVIAAGCVIGVALAAAVTRILEGMLFGVSPTDPLVMATVVAIVMAVATAGSLLPALRASTIDPMRVLRDD